jgi:hypothetical protein
MMRVVNKNQIIENNRQRKNKQNIKQEILKFFLGSKAIANEV